jgi:hypothetical protein
MTKNEVYKLQSAATDIETGDSIRILRDFDPSAHRAISDAPLGYTDVMDGYIGDCYTVLEVRDGNFIVESIDTFGFGSIAWPWYCVELEEKAQPGPTPIYVGLDKDVEIFFYDDYICVNDILIYKDTLDEIIIRLDEDTNETPQQQYEPVQRTLNMPQGTAVPVEEKKEIICDCDYCTQFDSKIHR